MTDALAPVAPGELLRDSGLDVVVIGASGWIGRATLDLLSGALGPAEFERRVHVLGSANRTVAVRPGLDVACRALGEWREVSAGPALVVHNAFLTRDRVQATEPAAYVEQNRAISAVVRELISRHDVRGIVLPSSGAARGPDGAPERDLARNPYGALKAEDEELFGALAAERGVPLAVPRIFGLSGPYINKPDLYALASFIEAVRRGDPIRIRARHPVFRSYVDVGDLLALCLAIVLRDAPGQAVAFDTAGEEPVEVGHLARTVAAVLDRAGHPVERELDPLLPADSYVGDPARISQLCTRHGIAPHPRPEQVGRTARYLYRASAGR